jgi:hypothetical protein
MAWRASPGGGHAGRVHEMRPAFTVNLTTTVADVKSAPRTIVASSRHVAKYFRTLGMRRPTTTKNARADTSGVKAVFTAS